MNEADASAPETPKGKLAKLLMPLLLVVFAGAGFSVTYFLDLLPASSGASHVEVCLTSAPVGFI